MRPFIVGSASRIRGTVIIPGDKSIAHRAVIMSAITPQKTAIANFPFNKDCLATVEALKKLGIRITLKRPDKVSVFGRGLGGLKRPKSPIFLGHSGTTLRLLLGVLAGQDFAVKLTAGRSLSRRPMLRVTAPLRMMGAAIKSKIQNPMVRLRSPWHSSEVEVPKSKIEEYPPIIIKGGNLRAITYKMPVASAQVKSAILLAGLYAKGTTCIIEPVKTRDHTERIFKLFKANIKIKDNRAFVAGGKELISPQRIFIPGDISSASFFLILASILPNSRVLIKNVSLNPSRCGIIKVLRRMGASIKTKNQKPKINPSTTLRVDGERSRTIKNYEPIGDISVRSSLLKGTVIKKEEIPTLIDELPILMVAASLAEGKSVFKGVGELRVKETDRIKSMSENLSKMGAQIKIVKTGKSEEIVIQGVKEFAGAKVKSFGDHRTAMSMIVAALKAKGKSRIDDVSCINKSFPEFLRLLEPLIKY